MAKWKQGPAIKSAGCQICNDGWPRWVNQKDGTAIHSLPEPAGDFPCAITTAVWLKDHHPPLVDLLGLPKEPLTATKAAEAPYDDKCPINGVPCGRMDCDPCYGECGAQAFAKPREVRAGGPDAVDSMALAYDRGPTPWPEPFCVLDGKRVPLTFPNHPLMPVEVAVFGPCGEDHQPRGWGCPWAWAATAVVAAGVLVLCAKGVAW